LPRHQQGDSSKLIGQAHAAGRNCYTLDEDWFARAFTLFQADAPYQFTQQELCIVIGGLAKSIKRLAGVPSSRVRGLVTLWQQRAAESMQATDTRNLANGLYSLGQLRKSSEDEGDDGRSDSSDAFLTLDPAFVDAWQDKASTSVEKMNAQDVSNILYAWARLKMTPRPSLVSLCQAHAVRIMHSFTSQGLSNSMWALGQLQLAPTLDFWNAWQQHALRLLHTFNEQNLSSCLCAFGRLDQVLRADLADALLQKSETHLRARCNTHQLSSWLHAFSISTLKPSSVWMSIWTEQAMTQLTQFSLANLSAALHACAKLGEAQVARAFLNAWTTRAEVCDGRVDRLDAQNLSVTIYALAQLGVEPDEAFFAAWTRCAVTILPQFGSQALSNSMYAWGKFAPHCTPALRERTAEFFARWQVRACAVITTFTPQGLSNSLYAFAQLTMLPERAFLDAWQKQAVHTLTAFDTQNLTNSLYAFSRLEEHPSLVFQAKWVQCLRAKMRECSSQQLVNSLYAYAQLRMKVDQDALLNEWQAAVVMTRMSSFNQQDLSNTMYAFSQLAVHPCVALQDAWYARALLTLKDWDELTLATSLYSLGKLGMRAPTAFLTACQARTHSIIDGLSTQSLANTLMTLAVFRAMDPVLHLDEYANILVSAIGRLGHASFSVSQLHQFFLASVLFPNHAMLNAILPVATNVERPADSAITTSITQCRLRDALSQRLASELGGWTIQEEAPCQAIKSQVDLLLVSQSQKQELIVQVDGPSHFVKLASGVHSLDGHTLLQNHILSLRHLQYMRIDGNDAYHHAQTTAEAIVARLKHLPTTTA
jgi:hypothetical protein